METPPNSDSENGPNGKQPPIFASGPVAFEIEEHPLDETTPLKVTVVGAGIAGILAGILLPAKVPDLQLSILERNADLGGVWYTNIYPGVRCDIPSDVYQSTFAPSETWSSKYPPGSEIQEYWKKLAQRYGVDKAISYNASVYRAEWSSSLAKWRTYYTQQEDGIETQKFEDSDILILATGIFSEPQLPHVRGLDKFQGHLVHSAQWDASFNAAGKRVAVIGNGSSGLQVVPQLQKVVEKLDHYARSPTWIAASFGGEEIPTQHREAPVDPLEYIRYRKQMENQTFVRYSLLIKGESMGEKAKEAFTKQMAKRLGNRSDLLDAILPDFSPNCRRLTPAPGYLEALTQDNVSYINISIEAFTETGIKTIDNNHREYDAVICCTGFDSSFTPTFPIIAGDDFDLKKAWMPEGSIGYPDTYLGMASPRAANLFFIQGPNATGHPGPLIHTIESQVTYVAKVLRKVSTQGIRTITPTQEAANDFKTYCDSYFPRTVMSENCRSWYNGGIPGGRNRAFWPGSAWHADLVRRDPRWEDFQYTYRNPSGNRFAYFGNGWTKKDVAAVKNPQSPPDFTTYLNPNSVTKTLDLRVYHEDWFEGRI